MPLRENRCRPSPRHELILRAALLAGEPTRRAYEEWRAQIDFQQIDLGTQPLLPLVAHNL
ncbi:MAG: hypothetical protein FJ144_07310 [Deltaproteobacteria bacterium]|nr:hypothetical protein [Deltaproteobacteria bacterium]